AGRVPAGHCDRHGHHGGGGHRGLGGVCVLGPWRADWRAAVGLMAAVKPIAVIDFETTGLSPAMGDRATEVAIVLVEGGRVVDRFQSLMNAGVRIPAFITGLTGITNAMVAPAPDATAV